MKKQISALLLSGAITLGLMIPGFASAGNDAQAAAQLTETEAEVSIVEVMDEQAAEQPEHTGFNLNGQPLAETGKYFVDGILYCSVRTFLEAALAEYAVTSTNGKLEILGTTKAGEQLYVTAKGGDPYLMANGRCLYVSGKVQSVRGITMAPAGLLASIFNGTIAWDSETETANVTLGNVLLTHGNLFYDAAELDLLSRLINAESGNQPLNGRIAVGNVIMNRMENSRFPDTMREVIYARNQFSVVSNGSIKRAPNELSVIAAKLTLEGVEVLPTALYFNQVGLNCWAARNRPYVTTIGGHSFYA